MFGSGILTEPEEAKAKAQEASDMAEGALYGYICSPTRGFFTDLFDCLVTRLGYISKHVKYTAQLYTAVVNFNAKVMAEPLLHDIVHSNAGISKWAASRIMSDDIKNKIHVTTLGTGKVITENEGFGSVINYHNENDLVTKTDLRFSFLRSQVTTTGYKGTGPFRMINDHYLNSPGYLKAFEYTIKNAHKSFENLGY